MIDDESLQQRAREALDARAEALDGATRSRLRQARAQALARARRPVATAPRLRWAVALAAVLLLAVAVVWQQQASRLAPEAVEDLEVLASSDDLELYQDLDFYLWLDESDPNWNEPERGRT